jgi:hypothetical protein
MAARVVFVAVGVLSLAGMVMRLMRNRLDAWFTLFSLGAVFVWTFSADSTTRLLYPFVPLLIYYAVDFVLTMLARWNTSPARRLQAAALIAALPIALCMPALMMIAQRGLDHRPVIAGCKYEYRNVWDYYTILNQGSAEKITQLETATLCGIEALKRVTPPDAVVMWARPEYVVLLGERKAVPFYYRWKAKELAAEIKRANVTHVLETEVFKNDLEGGKGRGITSMGLELEKYTTPILLMPGSVLAVREVNRTALDAFLD